MADSVYLYTKTSIVETSWAELKTNPSMITTGDLIPFALKNGEEVAVRAMHDGTGKLFFALENCFPEKHNMNPTDTNKGGWKDCEMRKWLNEEVFALLPNDLQEAIAATSIVTTGLRDGKTVTKDRLFLLSPKQVFGEGTQGQLDWFAEKRHRIKLDSEGNPCRWWLRSASSYLAFHDVNSSGHANGNDVYYTGGVALGFCLNP